MTQIFKHRCNTPEELRTVTDLNWGVEIDLRSDLTRPGKIHLSHDAWNKGLDFEDWLLLFKHLKIQGPIILNTKEDGLEERTIEMLNAQRITNFLFLDTTIPTLSKYLKLGLGGKFFVRLSKFEVIGNLAEFRKQVEWVWADCFDVEPLPETQLQEVSKDFKVCLVSPELQGGDVKLIEKFKGLPHTAACTKRPDLWT